MSKSALPVAIYEPRGRAREYAALALNLYRGCTHGCTYCYAPAVNHRTAAEFHATATPRPNIIEALRREAPKYAGTSDRVLLCFTSDPYQPAEHEHHLTRQALEILNEHRIPVDVLTKDPQRALSHDRALFQAGDVRLGTTLVFTSAAAQARWEPGAPTAASRMLAVRQAQHDGIPTWVSLEPVIDPQQTLDIICELDGAVDLWKVGKLNHDAAREAEIDWLDFLVRAMAQLDSRGCTYLLKRDLVEAAENRASAKIATARQHMTGGTQ